MNANEQRKRRAYYEDRFNGSPALFRACWRSLLENERSNGTLTHGETKEFLDARAGELVNDENSRFYIYG